MAFDDALIGNDDFDPVTATEDLIRRTHGSPLPPVLSPNMLNTRLARKLGQEEPAPKAAEEDDDEEEKPAKGGSLDFSAQAVPAPTNPSDSSPDFSAQATDPNAKPAVPQAPLGVSGNLLAAAKGVPVGALEATGGAIKGAGINLGNAQPTPAEMYAAAGIDPQTLSTPPTREQLETPVAKNPNNAITRAGRAVEGAAGAIPMTDQEKQSIGGTVGRMAGAVAPYAAIAAVNAPAGIAAGFTGMAADTYGKTYEDAKGKGASDDQAESAARNSALVAGALGSLPLGAGKLAKGLIAKAATSGAAFATLGEAQEWALQEIAKSYDKDAGYTPEAKRIIAELILGAGMGGLHHAFERGKEEEASAPGETTPPPAGALPSGSGASPGAGPAGTGEAKGGAAGSGPRQGPDENAGAGAGPQGGPQSGPGNGGAGAQANASGGKGQSRSSSANNGQSQSGPPPGTGEGKGQEFKFGDAAMRAKMEKIYRHFEPGKDPSGMSDGDLFNAVNEHLRDTSATGASAQEDTDEEKAQRAAHQQRKADDEILRSAGWTDAHINAMSDEQRQRYVDEINGHRARSSRAEAGPQPGSAAPGGTAQAAREAPRERPQPSTATGQSSSAESGPAATGRREAPIVPKTADDVVQATAAEPTPAQAKAGNYQHAHMELPHLGLEGEHGISTETGVGQTRISTDADGTTHEVRMQGGAYGYIKGTKGADGDHLDIKIGPHPQSPYVFVIDQHDPETGKFDELKVMAGYRTPLDAMHGYAIDYTDQGEKRIGHVTAMNADQFKAWLKSGAHTKALKPPASAVSQGEAGGQGSSLTEAPAEGPVAGVPKVSPAGAESTGVSGQTNTTAGKGSHSQRLTAAKSSTGQQEPLSLLQFIASKGGLKPHPELEAMDLHENHRVQIPGRKGFFGVVRPTGMDLDRMREAAEEAGYFRGEGQKTSTVRDLLDAINNELHNQRHAAEGEEGHETRREAQLRAEREAHEHGKAQELVDQLEATGHGELGPEIKARVLHLMAVHGMDPETAIDTALVQLDSEEDIPPEQINATFGPEISHEADLTATYGNGPPGAPEGAGGERREEEAPAESRARTPAEGEAAGKHGRNARRRGKEDQLSKYLKVNRPKQDDEESWITYRTEATLAYNMAKEAGEPASITGPLRDEAKAAEDYLHKRRPEVMESLARAAEGEQVEDFLDHVESEIAAGRTDASIAPTKDASAFRKAAELRGWTYGAFGKGKALWSPDRSHYMTFGAPVEGNQLNVQWGNEPPEGVTPPEPVTEEPRGKGPIEDWEREAIEGVLKGQAGRKYSESDLNRLRKVLERGATDNYAEFTAVQGAVHQHNKWQEKQPLEEEKPAKPTTEKGADNKEQLVIPGAEKIGQGEQAQRAAAKPMKAKAPQRSMDIGLFGTEKDQTDMLDMIRSNERKVEKALGPDAEKVDRDDIQRAASMMASNPDMDEATAFGRAVIDGAVDDGFLTKAEVTKAYGPQAEDVLESGREGASGGREPAEPQGAAPDEERADHPEEAGELPSGGEAGDEGGADTEAAGGAVEPAEGTLATEPAAAGTRRVPANEAGNAAEEQPAASAEASVDQRIKDAYEAQRARNGGFDTASIGSLLQATGMSKEALHQWIMARVKTGAATIHPTTLTQAQMPKSDREAAIHLPGHEPLFNVTLKPAAFEAPTELRPLSMSELGTMAQRIFEGRITADELKEGFHRAIASKDAIKAELGKSTIKQLAPRGAGGMTKPQIIDRKFESFLDAFNVHGGYSWSPFTETLETALKRQVEKTTDADIAAARERRLEALNKRKETYTNPQTLDQFESFIRVRGEDQLTPEQRKHYDELVAERNQANKVREQERAAKIEKVETPAEMKLVETKHTQKGHDLFVVQMTNRVEREVYDKLNGAAKKLGGYYSSYNKGGAVPGFQFKTREAAETFMAVKEGDVSRGAINAAKAEERQLNAVENLRQQADNMTRAADELINIDRKVNTARRAQHAAGAEARAAADKALATSMRNIANAIESGEAKHLGFVRTKSEIEMLDRLLRNTRREWADRQKPADYGERQKLEQKPVSEEMIDAASYPYPGSHVDNVLEMARAVTNVPGAKMAARRVIKDAEFDQGEKRNRYVADNLGKQNDLRTVAEAMQKLKPSDWPSQYTLETFDDYNRLRRIGIDDLPTLRAALREYLAHRGKEGKADPIKAAERALIGSKIPGYFPTPGDLVDRMIETADIKPGMKVLEPSAGKGDIADKLRAAAGDDNVDTVELNSRLRSILEAKGHKLIASDFQEDRIPEESYDRIVMNPPFEKGQDVLHVARAFDLLKPGGRLVAIMSEHPFFANDERSKFFRDWMEAVDGTSEKLPEGSFKDSERSTGVNTRLVVINKPRVPLQDMIESDRPRGEVGQAYTLQLGQKTGREHLIGFGPEGKTYLAQGTSKVIEIPPEIMDQLRTPGANVVLHHNHPSGRAFSQLDIAQLGLPGLHTLWAHGHTGHSYRVQLSKRAGEAMPEPAAGDINYEGARRKLFDLYKKVENLLHRPFANYLRTRLDLRDELNFLWGHMVNRALHEAGIVDYRTSYNNAPLENQVPGLSNAMKQAVITAQREFFHAPPAHANDRYSYSAGHPGNVGATLDRSGIDARLGSEAGSGQGRETDDSDETPRDIGDRGVTLGALGDPSRVLKEFKNFWSSTFQPELVSDRALTADPLFARYKSAQAQEKDAIIRSSESEWNYWNKKGDPERLDFLRRFERARYGTTFASPREEAMARRYRAMLDANWAEEQRWGSQASFVEDYMPHIWEKPAEWRAFSETKSAQVGPTWFQKKRTIDYIDEGLAAGLKLKYTNPVDIVVHRLLSGVDMRMRMQLLYALKDEALAWEGKQGGDQLVARGWRAINAPDRKEWVIHPDAQRLWKNAVDAKGLWQDEGVGGSMFRGWMALKNAWVPAKLAFSAFHPLHVQHINYADGMARGWDLLTKGHDPVGALKAVADGFMRPVYSAPGAYTGAAIGAIAGSFVGMPGWGMITGAAAGSAAFGGLKRAGLARDVDTLGRRARQAWKTRPRQQTPEQKALVSLMQDGGFVPQLSEQLKIAAKRQLAVSFQKALRREAGVGDYRRLISSLMRRPIEALQAPIFERWIPELKAAAYLNAASDLMRRRPELWTNHNDRRLALRAIAKSIDNRFGEMFYGNLFWDRYLKDAGIASFLSLGWNLGFVREFGGAAFEAVSRPIGLIPGMKPSAPRKQIRSATNKIPFVIGYVATAALINGLMTALFTGDHPQGLDFIFARIGGQNPDGSPRRVTNMFYLREIPMLIKHVQERGGNVLSGAGEMIWNKMMFEPFSELLNNRDYYGYNIWDENAPIYKQIGQAIHHTFGDQGPMAVSGAQQAARLSGHEFPSAKESLEHPDRLLDALRAKGVDLSILGFGPAPSYVEKSSIQNRIGYLYRQHVAPSSRPNADEENSIGKMAVRTAIMIAKRDKDSEMLSLARERGKALGLSTKYMADIGKTPTDVYLFSKLPDADQRSLLESASAEEKARYLQHAHQKVRQEINRARYAPQPSEQRL